jgi:lysophospholipase L1-like esterase
VIAAAPPAAAPAVADVRILSLGDSYTIGESVPEADRWPLQLATLLRAKGVRVATPTIVAQTGWTTDELSAGIDAAKPTGTFDVVTVLIGVNNQYRGRSVDEFRIQLRALLQRAVGFAGGRASRVIVVGIPDWGVTPFAEGRDRARVGAEIDAFNAVNRAEAEAIGGRYVDIAAIARRARTTPTLIAHDGLHPSGAMYAEWARAILPAAEAALATQ